MAKRMAAIVFIFGCTTVAWVILGSTILFRTHNADSALRGVVASNWGAPQTQKVPLAYYETQEEVKEEVQEPGGKAIRTKQVIRTHDLLLNSSRVDAAIDLEHRQKGLLWYSTYKVSFAGDYTFENQSGQNRLVHFALPFPASSAIYDDLVFTIDGQPAQLTIEGSRARAAVTVANGQSAVLRVGYKSQGLGRWAYNFGGEVARVRDFTMNLRTNFKAIDFPENSLSPSEKRETPQGWDLVWNYRNLMTGYEIAVAMPEKLQPGPLAGQISYFAPVSLFFFFFLMWIITTLRNIELHPMNYFFLAGAFFAFHLLLAYLVDHISIHAAFAASSVVSVFLVVSYLRLVVGIRFAAVEAALAQIVYLVLFSYAFFIKGFTGLAVTIGSILTLFVVMQMTGRIRWSEKFSPQAAGRVPAGS
jgi:inner membrane protein involved in colicin E2 resistance